MQIVMMGTGPFAVPTLRRLYDSAHTVAALVTRPPRALHGKSQDDVNPMRALARQHGTPILEPESINASDAQAAVASYAPELLIVCDYGQILSPQALAVAPHGGINLHASLLPKYRGAAPINWALYHGEEEAGVTVIHMTPRVDAGPAIAQARTPIEADETAVELEQRLAVLGAELVLQSIDALERGETQAIEQDPSLASRAPRLKKSDGLIDWNRPANAIRNQVRAMQPWPKAFTFLERHGKEPLRLILDDVVALGSTGPDRPGTIVEATNDRLLVATGDGVLQVNRIQPAGKRVLDAAEFVRGYPVKVGDQLRSPREKCT